MDWLKPLLLITCGAILFLSALIVIKGFLKIKIRIPFHHPWDYWTHFITSLCGVIFFFIIFRGINLDYKYALAFSVFIILILSFIKEFLIDVRVDPLDIITGIPGILFACFVTYAL